MDKKLFYCYSGIAIAFIAALLLGMEIECLLVTLWLWLFVGLLIVGVLLYDIALSAQKG